MAENKKSFEDVEYSDSSASSRSKKINASGEKMRLTTVEVNPGKKPGFCRQLLSWRVLILILLQFSIVTIALPRSTFNMAFVCGTNKRLEAIKMTNWSAKPLPVGDRQYETNGQLLTNFSLSLEIFDEADGKYQQSVFTDLNWETETRGLVLAAPAFLTGVGPILTDLLRQRLGNRCVFTGLYLFPGIIMFIMPTLARASTIMVIIAQVVIGITMEAITPIIADALSRWTPVSQRLTAVFVVFSGQSFGPMITSLVNGFLCSIPSDNGWPFIFYVSGLAYFLYAAAWNLLGSDWPETHRFISESEKSYILYTRVELVTDGAKRKPDRPPYLTMVRSSSVVAFVYLFCCLIWGNYVVLVMGPLYLSSVHGFSVQQTGIVFSFVVATRLCGALLWTVLGNIIINKEVLPRSITRKIFLTFGFAGAGLSLLIMVFLGQDSRWISIASIMVSQFLQAVSTGHLSAVPQDMAPRYAGTLHGLAASVSSLAALTAPLIVSALTPKGFHNEWRVVWIILSSVYISGSLAFLVFGEAKLQAWAAVTPGKNVDTETVADGGNPSREVDGHPLEQEPIGKLSLGPSRSNGPVKHGQEDVNSISSGTSGTNI